MENSEPKESEGVITSMEERLKGLLGARVKLVEQLERTAADINRIDGAAAVLRDIIRDMREMGLTDDSDENA